MAQVSPVSINAPGRWGVNEQEADQLLNPNWATKADGLVLNDSARLQCRGALRLISTDGAPTEILRSFVYVNAAGTETVIHTTATKIISGIADLDDASTDITPTGAPTNGFWKFANFNGKVIGWQASHTPIVWSGSGDFAVITAASGTLPDGDAMCAAFGRVWAVDDDGQTIRISALLDETRWDTADGGASIDMRNVWTAGMDRVMGIAAFGANLVIFGRKHIIFYTDGQGSAVGLDPTQMYVVDTIEGTGLAARDSIAHIGEGDLVFLSETGVQSLRRILQQKDNPLITISWQIADRLGAAVASEIVSATDTRTWTGHYIPQTGQYMLVHTTTEDVYVFHVDGQTFDEMNREVTPITIWDTPVLTNIRGFITLRTGVTYTTGAATHELYRYRTDLSTDEGSTAIPIDYESGWLKLDSPEFDAVNKTLKLVQITVDNPSTIDSVITCKYGTDYIGTLDELAAPTADEERVINLYDTTGNIEGQYFKLGLEDTSFGLKVLQQITPYFSAGRTAFIHTKLGQTFDDVAFAGPQFIGEVLTDSATGNGVSATLTLDIPVPGDTDGLLILLATNDDNLPTISTIMYGGQGSAIAQGNFPTGVASNASVAMYTVEFDSAPTSSNLVLTFSAPVTSGEVITALLYPFRDATDIENASAIAADSAGSTIDLSGLAALTVHNTAMIFTVSYATGGVGPYESTVSDSRFTFLDSRFLDWNTTSKMTITSFIYSDVAAVTVTPTATDSDPNSSRFAGIIVELPD